MSKPDITYRFAEAGDLPEIIRLWVEETEWGVFPFVDSERWIASPGGMPRTVLAIEEGTGTVVGQFGFVPTLINLEGELLRGVRPHSTIVGKRLRDLVASWNPADQPGFAMYRFGIREMAREGVTLAHMLPNPRWSALIRIFPGMQRAQFPLWTIPFPLSPSFSLPEGFVAAPLDGWGDEVDRLWDLFAGQYACSVVRDARMLEWKSGLEGSRAVTVRKDRELVGLVTGRMKGDRQWTISDMITADAKDALRATIAAAVLDGADAASAPAASGQDFRPVKAGILATPLMVPFLSEWGFTQDSYNFSLVVQSLDSSLDAAKINPQGWYLAATD